MIFRPLKCGVSEACTATHVPIGRWRPGVVRDVGDGWYFSRQGWSACPLHLPAWVVRWRAENDRPRRASMSA